MLAESVLNYLGRNYLTGRAELVDKDELFHGQDVPEDIEHGVFQIGALTLGYSRDVLVTKSMRGALGANFTIDSVPGEIQPYYDSSPHSVYVFLRLRGGSAMSHAMH